MSLYRVRPIAEQFRAAVESEDDDALCTLDPAVPVDVRDGLLTLLSIYDLSLAPVQTAPGRARWQHHHVVASLRDRCEAELRAWLGAESVGASSHGGPPVDAVAGMRAIAGSDRVPTVYEWVAESADWDDLVHFLALEGGPDDGFDDLVASCQVGLEGRAKMEMGRNFWDEMGNGSPDRVHRVLYRRFTQAVDLPHIPRSDQPIGALRRAALNGYLATNRHLQPELIGALGLTELQAGPRCRKVVAGLQRHRTSADDLEFYVEHADTDPRHGKAWLDEVVAPLSEDPWMAQGILRGAAWRSTVNRHFFDALAAALIPRVRLLGAAS